VGGSPGWTKLSHRSNPLRGVESGEEGSGDPPNPPGGGGPIPCPSVPLVPVCREALIAHKVAELHVSGFRVRLGEIGVKDVGKKSSLFGEPIQYESWRRASVLCRQVESLPDLIDSAVPRSKLNVPRVLRRQGAVSPMEEVSRSVSDSPQGSCASASREAEEDGAGARPAHIGCKAKRWVHVKRGQVLSPFVVEPSVAVFGGRYTYRKYQQQCLEVRVPHCLVSRGVYPPMEHRDVRGPREGPERVHHGSGGGGEGGPK